MLRKYNFFLYFIFWTIEQSESSSRKEFRSQRDSSAFLQSPALVYPYGGTLKLLMGCAVPISMPGRILVYGQNFQFQYALPQNASYFSGYSRRRRRNTDPNERSILYRLIERELPRRTRGGFTAEAISGKDCVKRTICETAETPLGDDGLLGEILQVLFTPDYGGSVSVAEEYKEAALIGRRGGNCYEAYPSCPRGFGILDHITTVFNPH